jgi:WD40 repeat protein
MYSIGQTDQHISWVTLGVLYSIILYDTDLKEEVWVEDAAHHGPVYDLKWSRDDRCLLSCSGDGTCKVWDMSPTAFRSNNLMGFGALNASAAGVGGTHSRGASGNVDPTLLAGGAKPPSLICSMVSSPPVYTYTGVFQDQSSPSPVGGLVDPTGRYPTVPRVITGAADGKIRVWDGPEMVGYVVVTNKEKEGAEEVTDYSPHDGQINSIVIDERSR